MERLARMVRFGLLVLACTATAQACSSCSVPEDADGATARGAYYWTAIFLTLLPILLVLALVRWLRRQGLGVDPPSP